MLLVLSPNQLYNTFIVGFLQYSSPALHGLSRATLHVLESLQVQSPIACIEFTIRNYERLNRG